MDPEDQAFLRQLIEETKALPQAKMPGALSRAFWHPGVLSYETKSPRQYDQDMRRKHFLDKLNERYGANPTYLGSALSGPLVAYRAGEMDDLGTPYQKFGSIKDPLAGVVDIPYDGRMPLAKAFQWFSAPAAVAINASKVVANRIDPAQRRYPDAEKNLAKAINTATIYGAEDSGFVPKGTGTAFDEYTKETDERSSIPWQHLDARPAYEAGSYSRQAKIDEAIPSSWQSLEQAGVPAWLAALWGGVMDTVLDPFGRSVAVVKMARSGMPGALKELVKDYAVGVGVPSAGNAVGAVPEVTRRVDELLDRLHGVNSGR